MKMDLELPRDSFPEIIANKLEEMIIESKFTVKQKLPSEQALAEDFGVSRPVIRETMKILKERGLIVQKNGGGTFIREPDSAFVTDMLNRIVHLRKIDVKDIFEVRLHLETMAVSLAAARADEQEIGELQKINDYMKEIRDDVAERAHADILFHKKIAQLSGNPLLEVFVESMVSLVMQIMKYTLEYDVGNEEGIVYHDCIIEELRARDATKAQETLRQHLENAQKNYTLASEKEAFGNAD